MKNQILQWLLPDTGISHLTITCGHSAYEDNENRFYYHLSSFVDNPYIVHLEDDAILIKDESRRNRVLYFHLDNVKEMKVSGYNNCHLYIKVNSSEYNLHQKKCICTR